MGDPYRRRRAPPGYGCLPAVGSPDSHGVGTIRATTGAPRQRCCAGACRADPARGDPCCSRACSGLGGLAARRVVAGSVSLLLAVRAVKVARGAAAGASVSGPWGGQVTSRPWRSVPRGPAGALPSWLAPRSTAAGNREALPGHRGRRRARRRGPVGPHARRRGVCPPCAHRSRGVVKAGRQVQLPAGSLGVGPRRLSRAVPTPT